MPTFDEFVNNSSAAGALSAADQLLVQQSGVSKETDLGAVADFVTADQQSALDGRYLLASNLIDEDTMATNSATKVPSQQSVKAYVDGGFVQHTDQERWRGAADFTAVSGTPALSQYVNRYAVFLLDASADEAVSAQTVFPSTWATVDVFIWWLNTGAGSGDVRWRFTLDNAAPGASVDVTGTHLYATATADTTSRVVRTAIATNQAITAANIYSMRVTRLGTDGADTLTNDAGLLGVQVVCKSPL